MYTFNNKKITKDFQRWFGVRIVGWLEPNLLNADFFIEFSQDTNQMIKSKISVNNEPFDLMELSQVSIIKSLISENSIDREELSWSERFFFGNLF